MKLPLIPLDKANHFIYGFAIFILASLLFTSIWSLLIVTLFAIAKEFYDYKSYGLFSIADMIVTILPAMIMIGYLELI